MIAFAQLLAHAVLATAAPAPMVGVAPPLPPDFVIEAGQNFVLDTDNAITFDGTGQLHSLVNGRLFVNDFIIADDAELLVRGAQPLRIRALGKVTISGLLDLSGDHGKDVAGVGTAVFPEPGAIGGPGGGRGGFASIEQTKSTPSGNKGFGPWMLRSGGGGGESGYGGTQNSSPANRRGAGGAGGTFGPDASGTVPPNFSATGLAAQPGSDGSPQATGAMSGIVPRGGKLGRSPFRDGNPNNDFWGVGLDGQSQEMIVGELPHLWAGSGGGGGGDSVRSQVFPHPNFSSITDDKGAAGGGGGGSLYLRARKQVRLFNPMTGAQGSIRANGGDGARGQLVLFLGNFFTPSGAGGGGGSGGHIVIESKDSIRLGSNAEALQARGGAGGQQTQSGGIGAGGDGGPGVIQLHAPGGLQNITAGIPLNAASVPAPKILLPH